MPKKKAKEGFPPGMIAIAAVAVVAVLLVLWFIGTYNSLIGADQNVKNAWANVETQYQRRIDLIPNLVNSVKGYMQFEKSVLTSITALRSQWMSAQTAEEKVGVANQLESALKTIMLTYEAYPNIKADTTVTALMDELAGTENRIAVARMNYNEAILGYNNLVKFIPSNFVAGFMGYLEKTMFAAVAGAETAPVVNISA